MLFPDRCVRRRRERDQIPADQQSVLFRTLGGLNEFAQKRTKTAKKTMLTGHGTTKHADLDDVKTLDTSDPRTSIINDPFVMGPRAALHKHPTRFLRWIMEEVWANHGERQVSSSWSQESGILQFTFWPIAHQQTHHPNGFVLRISKAKAACLQHTLGVVHCPAIVELWCREARRNGILAHTHHLFYSAQEMSLASTFPPTTCPHKLHICRKSNIH